MDREKAAKILRDFIYAKTKHPGCEYVALDQFLSLIASKMGAVKPLLDKHMFLDGKYPQLMAQEYPECYLAICVELYNALKQIDRALSLPLGRLRGE